VSSIGEKAAFVKRNRTCSAGWWFGQMTEEKIDDVLDALDGGEPPADSLLFS
jgi:hypothetical protein